MSFGVYSNRKDDPCLFAICTSRDSAERWVDRFNPQQYTDKTWRKNELEIREYKTGK